MAGKRLALLIANANYQHPELRKLNAPHSDVRALEALLKRADIGGYQTQLLIDGTKAKMEETIEALLTDAERDDTALIFFAGHGIKHENGKLYFAAIDTKPNYLGHSAVAASWLTEQMQNSRVGRQIILLDCCFGGAFARGHVFMGGDRVESGKALEVPELELEDRGQVVITSADAMQFAFEAKDLSGRSAASHFVRALTEGLETGEADRLPQDGKINIDELWSYLVKKLKMMGSCQRPSKWSFGSVGGDLVFAYNPRVNIAKGSAGRPTLPLDWERQAKQSLDAKDYRKALQIYEMAAETGDTESMAIAMNNLGTLYEQGLGVAQDYAKAREFYEKAAERGDIRAMANLGQLYQDGLGVAKDPFIAMQWFQKTAQ